MIRFMREDAVSPVLGVVLMVAITVILAAIIASLVFGMTETVNVNPYAGIAARQVGTDITITYMVSPSGGSTISNLSVKLDGEEVGYLENPSVGDTIRLEDMGTPANDHIIVVATYSDGRQAIVLDTNV